MQQAVGLLRRDLAHGHARPLRDHVGDIVGRDRDAALAALLEAALGLLELVLDLLLIIADARGAFVVLRGDCCFLLHAELLEARADLLQLLRLGDLLHADLRGRFIHEVDGLVWQEAVGDVAVREAHGRLDGRILDMGAVEGLVLAAQPHEDLLGVLDARLLDEDGLEAARERGILLEVLLVLVERRRADDLDLAARQGGFQDIGRIECALRRARADERVHLVDEQDDRAVLAHLVDEPLEALLELAAVLRAGDERGERQRDDLLVLQHVRHRALDDTLREPLGDGRLADTRLA